MARTKRKKVDTTQCKRCLYRAERRAMLEMGCNCYYILLMNEIRPSEPSPYCTVFKEYNEKERQELNRNIKNNFVSGERGIKKRGTL